VSFRLLVAPPGAGKTELLLARARSAALAGSRVWWVGQAAQRASLFRRATEAGALLGLASSRRSR
jgi:KaiC/GvpD/RAD55 family RecA-like ATPase